MSKTDELDRGRAPAYAWRLIKPGDELPSTDAIETTVPVEVAAEADEAEAAPDLDFDDERREVFEACAAIAEGVERAWLLPDAEQAAALTALLLRGSELSLGLTAMQHYPRQSVRLLRLAIRCADRLPDEAIEAARACAFWLDYSDPEIVDLLAEVALAGDRSLATGIQMAIHGERGEEVKRVRGASARFARVLDEGETPEARHLAIIWMHLSGVSEAVPALRRALRRPHFALRFRALDVLDQQAPEAIQADDVVFLIEDTIAHPPPDLHADEENSRARWYTPELLERAVVRLRPAAVAAPLVQIVESGSDARFGGSPLDATWALGALAAAFPEEATPRIDRMLRRVEWDRRERAVEAAGHLPDDLAWPRLLAGAVDPVPEIAARAQQIWLKRRGSLCPVGELDGLEVALLDGPPSERMPSRLAVLRRAPLEARAAMVEVLLAEAPDPEALVLLLFAAGDENLWTRKPRPGLPASRKDFCRALVEGFGARAVEGICALDARFPDGRWTFLDVLAELLGEGKTPAEASPALRAAAARRVASGQGIFLYATLGVLAKLGAPLDLLERLLALAADPEQKEWVRHAAARALATLKSDDARLDRALVEEMEAALVALDLPRFERAALVGLRRKLPAAIALTERALAEHLGAPPTDAAVITALASCVDELDVQERLPATWTDEALGKPGTYAFCVAAGRLRHEITPERKKALKRGLLSRDPATASIAASTLLHAKALRPKSKRLPVIASRGPLALRAELVWALVYLGAPPDTYWSTLEEILVSPDRDATERLHLSPHRFDNPELRARLLALTPRISDPVLLETIEDLRDDEEPEYWEDVVEDE